MILKKYDCKCVKIIDNFDNEYEGVCYYNSKDYNFHEYGRDEEGLEILHFLFFKTDIKKIVNLEKNQGLYGKFSFKYGEIEKITVEDGLDSVIDVFESEENEHIYRLLLYIEDNISKISFINELILFLQKINIDDVNIQKEIVKLINIYEKNVKNN